ncbi:MAG: SDR family NAD(P)-dependent oxidoreductase, partial [Deltaproteobacteria bacterium]|nr:SDR family NAD(P)-dependent oxidoreductase [Deltaproteobacteria bacterium]
MKDVFDLRDHVAVVTGASGRLGPVWIEALLDYGATVFSIDRQEAPVSPGLERLLARFEEERLRLFRADVRNRESLETACEECVGTMGVPSILVNNAGIDQPPGEFRKGYRLEEIPLEV